MKTGWESCGVFSIISCRAFSLEASSLREYEIPIVREGDGTALKRLKRLIGPFVLRRVKKDVLKELPDKMEEVVYSNFETEQKKLYAANAAKFKEKLSTGGFGQAGKESSRF